MKRTAWVLAAATAVSGCELGGPVDTPSKNLEITVSDVRLDCVRGIFTDVLVGQGYQVLTSNEHQLDVGRKTHDLAVAIFSWDTTPEERILVSFIPQSQPNDYRVIVTGLYVVNPGTKSEKAAGMVPSGDYEQALVATKGQFEARCHV